MPLTDEATELARYLVDAWDNKIIEPYFELADVTAGADKTVQVVPLVGVLDREQFHIPPFAILMELSAYPGGLVNVREEKSGRGGKKWIVQLTQNLRDAVKGGVEMQDQSSINANVFPSFFISYKSEDRRLTDQLAKYLRRVYGAEQVWFDTSLYGGQRWWNQIMNQLGRREVLIYLLSREAVESVYCRAEFTEAWRLGKQIIPVQIRGEVYPVGLRQFQIIRAPQGELTIDSIVEIFAAVVQGTKDVPPVLSDGQWGTRVILAVDPKGIQVNVKVSARRDPGKSDDKPYCNTGVLLVPEDEVEIKASGSITVDSGYTWYDPNGVFMQPGASGIAARQVHPRDDTYRASGYPKEIFDAGDRGIVGSLIGWIENDTSALDRAFVVGNSFSKTLIKGQEGFLYLAVNDTQGAYGDNEGTFDVSIKITHAG